MAQNQSVTHPRARHLRASLKRARAWLRARRTARPWTSNDAVAARHLQRDFITQLSLCVMIYGVFLARLVWVSAGAGDVARPSEAPPHDPAQHVAGSADAAPAGAATPRCMRRVGSVFFVVACGGVAYERGLFGASNDLRIASGAPACWWHASWQDLQRVRGITESNAMLAVKLRERETRLARPEELSEAMGAHRARLLTTHTSLRCALEPRSEGASDPRDAE